MDSGRSKRRNGSWTGPRPFVGREAVLEALQEEVGAVLEGGGRAVFLLGAPGAGKSALAGLFQELAYRRHRELEAQYVDCVHSGTRTWEEMAEIFTRDVRIREGLRKVALDWVDAIPVVGPVLRAIGSTIEAVRHGVVQKQKTREFREPPEQSALKAVRMLLQYGADEEHRLIIMDAFERGDSEDLAGAAALIPRLEETRTLFLATVRTVQGKPPRQLDDLILEAERLGRARRITLEGLSVEELTDAVGQATRGEVPPEWAEWLHARSRGLPAALWDLLGELQAAEHLTKAGRSWSWEGVPAEVEVATSEGAGAEPLKDLSSEDRRLLGIAAVTGDVFHCLILSELTGIDELELEDRLSALTRSGVLEYRGTADLGGDLTSEYAIANPGAVAAAGQELPSEERQDLLVRLRDVRERLGLPAGEL